MKRKIAILFIMILALIIGAVMLFGDSQPLDSLKIGMSKKEVNVKQFGLKREDRKKEDGAVMLIYEGRAMDRDVRLVLKYVDRKLKSMGLQFLYDSVEAQKADAEKLIEVFGAWDDNIHTQGTMGMFGDGFLVMVYQDGYVNALIIFTSPNEDGKYVTLFGSFADPNSRCMKFKELKLPLA